MTREEAVKEIEKAFEPAFANYIITALTEGATVSDKGLEQEPTTKIEESNFSQEQYLADIQSAYDCGKSVIDKIRAEIEQNAYPIVHGVNNHEFGMTLYGILQIINKYKAESEDKE